MDFLTAPNKESNNLEAHLNPERHVPDEFRLFNENGKKF